MAMTALKGISMIMTATPASTDGPRFCKIQQSVNHKFKPQRYRDKAKSPMFNKCVYI